MSRRLAPLLALLLVAAGVLALGLGPAEARATGPASTQPLSKAQAHDALEAARDLFTPAHVPATARQRADRAVDASMVMRDLWQARPTLTGTDRALADRILARPTDPGGDELFCDSDYCYYFQLTGALGSLETAHFDLHFTANPASSSYVDPAFATTIAQTLEHVYTAETSTMGFRVPISDASTASPFNVGNPDGKIDIYLGDIGRFGIYGYCTPDDSSTSSHTAAYCALDNDFAAKQFGGAKPLDSLRVTAAHEFFHAIQFGYDTNEDTWLMEGSAVWMEDQVYNSINDYLQYVPISPIRRPRTPVDKDTDFGVYGAFSFFKFLTGYLHDRNAVKQVWQDADSSHSPDRYSLQAVDAVIAAHHRSPRVAYSMYGAWNTLPAHTYPERASYSPAGLWHTKTLSRRNPGAGTWSVVLDHLANAPVKLVPARSLGRRSRVRIWVNAPDQSKGGAATLQVRYRSGRVALTKFPINSHGNGSRSVTFNPHTVSSVVVTLSNGSSKMRNCSPTRSGAFSCGGYGVWKKSFSVRAHLR